MKLRLPIQLPRRGDRTLTPALFAGGLFLLLLVHLLLPIMPELPASEAVVLRQTDPLHAAEVHDFPAVIANSAFVRSRQDDMLALSPGGAPNQFRLIGVVTGKRIAKATVRAADGRILHLSPGQEVGGYKLVSVGPEKAVFAREDRKLELKVAGLNAAGGTTSSDDESSEDEGGGDDEDVEEEEDE